LLPGENPRYIFVRESAAIKEEKLQAFSPKKEGIIVV
jgi:hypothetical protein